MIYMIITVKGRKSLSMESLKLDGMLHDKNIERLPSTCVSSS